MNGGVDKIDIIYEKLRTDIQKRLSTSTSKEEYICSCKEILQEIARRPDSDKFLDIYEKVKTMFYDFTPDLINETKKQIAEQKKKQFLVSIKIKTENILESSKQIELDQKTMEQELEQGEKQ